MGSQPIREPKQQRSIEKRNKIIEAGYRLFCEKGYYNTNTAEIAKLAGVSTGIVYSYFKDKKDIFLLVIEAYSNHVAEPMIEKIRAMKPPVNLEESVRQIIAMLTASHTMVKSVHEEMEALAHTDDEISEIYSHFQAGIAKNLVVMMDQLGIRPTHAYEKVHLIIDLVDNLVHETVYRRHEYLDYDVMTEEAVKIIINMLET